MKSMVREHFGDLDIDGKTTKIILECQESGHNKQNVTRDTHFLKWLPKILIYCKGNHRDSNKTYFQNFENFTPN
jgi:hypothetical protein